jgi:deazaflavin-dependent oxidoreductase (nitroreductase family)
MAKPPPRLVLKAAGGLNRSLFRLTNGKVGGSFRGARILLLTTTGRRSGRPRTTPLLYLEDGDDYVLTASYGGADVHPAWYQNLTATPDVAVEIGAGRERRRARTASGEERARLWPQVTAMYPAYDGYQAKTAREIPLVILERSRPAE